MSKRFLQASVAVFTLVLAIVPAQAALAHPLGNFTISRYSRLELERTETHLVYIVDRAEVPTFQEREKIDANRDGQISTKESDSYLSAERVRLHVRLFGRGRQSRRSHHQPRPLQKISGVGQTQFRAERTGPRPARFHLR